MKTFENIASLKLATLKEGQFVETGGYYSKGDGGGARYLIATPQSADEYGDHTLANGNVAVLQGEAAVLLQYGAKGDGVSDDTLPIRAAIESGKPVQAGSKTYYVLIDGYSDLSTVFSVPEGFRLTGDGATIKTESTIATSPLDITLFGVADVGNVSFSGVRFVNVTASFDRQETATSTYGVHRHIYISNTSGIDVENINVSDCHFESPTASGVATLRPSDDSWKYRNIRVSNCTFENIGVHCVGFNNTEDGIVTGCYAHDVGNIIFADPEARPGLFVDVSQFCNNCVVDGNTVDWCRTGIKTQTESGETGRPVGCVISNNIIRNMKNEGNGYIIQSGGERDVISGNTVDVGVDEDSGVPSVIDIDGILVTLVSVDAAVNGNTVYVDTGSGISVQSATESDPYIMANCVLSGNTVTSINSFAVQSGERLGLTITNNSLVSVNANRTVSLNTLSVVISNNNISNGYGAIGSSSTGAVFLGTLATTQKTRDVIITGNKIDAGTNNGIVTTETLLHSVISDNSIYASRAIFINGDGDAVSISGNSLTSTDDATILSGSSNSLTQFSICNNILDQKWDDSQAHNIRGPFNKTIIAGNSCKQVNGSASKVSITGGGDFVQISNNVFDGGGSISNGGAGSSTTNNLLV